MTDAGASLAETRAFHASLMAAASGSRDPRLEAAFGAVPRENFMPPGPWLIRVAQGQLFRHGYFKTPSADPRYLYQNALVALDAERGINNGEPFLHAAWIGAVAPRAGETVTHIGAGTGYYTALLSLLVKPGGKVRAFEIDKRLGAIAKRNLAAYPGVTVTVGDATRRRLPLSDLIYVNAGAVAPPPAWLQALLPGGRLVFPWQPAEGIGLTMVVTRMPNGFAARPLMPSWFIACIGASDGRDCEKTPTRRQAAKVRSLWLTADKPPTRSAVAICGEVWFSSSAVRAH